MEGIGHAETSLSQLDRPSPEKTGPVDSALNVVIGEAPDISPAPADLDGNALHGSPSFRRVQNDLRMIVEGNAESKPMGMPDIVLPGGQP